MCTSMQNNVNQYHPPQLHTRFRESVNETPHTGREVTHPWVSLLFAANPLAMAKYEYTIYMRTVTLLSQLLVMRGIRMAGYIRKVARSHGNFRVIFHDLG